MLDRVMFREFLPRKFASKLLSQRQGGLSWHDREHVGDRKVP
jgi:hypothetical protein